MKLWRDENNGVYNYGLSETQPNGNCTDVTNSIVDWYNATNVLDYYGRQRRIKSLVITKVLPDFSQWSILTAEEKQIATELIIAPYSLRLTIVSDSTDKENWDKLVKCSEGSPYQLFEGRRKIYQDMRIVVSDYVRREVWQPGDYLFNLSNAQAFFRDVFLMKEYYMSANDPEFGDFIKTTGMHAATGFKFKSYYNSDLEADLIAIYDGY